MRVAGWRGRVMRWGLVAAAGVASVSCAADATVLDGPMHDAARDYLRTVSDGGSPAAFYGTCGGTPDSDAHRVLTDEGTGFTVELTGSTESGGTGTVNATVTGRDGSPTAYAVDLRRENGTWVVCDMDTGNVELGGEG
ncbi:hypothetical protein [Yinghuangia sp. YIM S10712]|uniref:hypothetical protein n=1 Tax=Yinghuangia sp. YIM S10712 TaxID=3436930 RepID=UPI003F5303D1